MESQMIKEEAKSLREEAYAVFSESLLKMGGVDPQSSAADVLRRLMAGLAAAEDAGGICAYASEEEAAGMGPLFDSGLVVDDSRMHASGAPLAFRRESSAFYFAKGCRIEARLAALACAAAERPAEPFAAEELSSVEAVKNSFSINSEQRAAVERALAGKLCIVSGGPGTGKTSTIVKMLECLLAARPDAAVGLAAPTGKAAGRMKQSILSELSDGKGLYERVRGKMESGSIPSKTIHKWLWTRSASGELPGPSNPLDLDVLVVDEASMIDVYLAERLFSAVDSSRTKMIVLGDRHQLAAVGPGSVFADLSDLSGALSECCAHLTKSYRFGDDTPIGRLAAAVNSGRADAVEEAFAVGSDPERWTSDQAKSQRVELKSGRRRGGNLTGSLAKAVEEYAQEHVDAVEAYLQRKDSSADARAELWKAVERRRFLCAQRRGVNGLEAVNEAVEEAVAGLLDRRASGAGGAAAGDLVIVRRNDDEIGVSNGDVAVVLEKEDGSGLEAYFGDEAKSVPLGLLPEYDLAFALTIHQSQGSQYEQVEVVLPHDPKSSLASRELLYTGITRARRRVVVHASKESLNASLSAGAERSGELASRMERIREGGE